MEIELIILICLIFFCFFMKFYCVKIKQENEFHEPEHLVIPKNFIKHHYCSAIFSDNNLEKNTITPGSVYYLNPGEKLDFIKSNNLSKCKSCGSSSFSAGRCDYCGQ